MPKNSIRENPAASLGLDHFFPKVYIPGSSKQWSPLSKTKKRRSRRAEYYCGIDVSALIGILWVLFLILVLTQPSPHHGVGVDLVKSEYSTPVRGARREDAMTVTVTRDGKMYFANRQSSRAELPDKILAALRGRAENRVYLLVDARARYSDVEKALEGVQRSQVRHVTFLTEALQP